MTFDESVRLVETLMPDPAAVRVNPSLLQGFLPRLRALEIA
jgi:hypothetical protein